MPLYLQSKIHHSKNLQLERSCFLKANRGVGNNGVVMAKNNTKCWCKCFGRYSPQELKTISTKKLEPSTSSFTFHSQRTPMPHEVFPPKSSSAEFGHDWLIGSSRRRRRWMRRTSFASTAVFASRSRWTTESGPNDCKEIPKEYLKLLTRLGEESLDEAENVQEVS